MEKKVDGLLASGRAEKSCTPGLERKKRREGARRE